jgi:hypothetical protein
LNRFVTSSFAPTARRHRPVVLVHVLDDAHVVEQVHRAFRAVVAEEALRGRVEVVGTDAERALDAVADLVRQRLAARRQALELDAQPARLLFLGEQCHRRRVGVDVVRLELVETRDELGERLRDAQAHQPVDPDVEALGAAAAHVCRRPAADHCQAQARQPRLGSHPFGAAQEHRGGARPARAVVDVDGLPARRPARRHHAVLAEVERVVLDAVEMLEQGFEPEAAVGDEAVEALHQVGLREDGQVAQLEAAARDALAPQRCSPGREGGQLAEALALERLEPLARPALTLEQRPAFAQASREVLKPGDPVAHRVLLRPETF